MDFKKDVRALDNAIYTVIGAMESLADSMRMILKGIIPDIIGQPDLKNSDFVISFNSKTKMKEYRSHLLHLEKFLKDKVLLEDLLDELLTPMYCSFESDRIYLTPEEVKKVKEVLEEKPSKWEMEVKK
jgi:hypothetical protein